LGKCVDAHAKDARLIFREPVLTDIEKRGLDGCERFGIPSSAN
jgi:hypothetical protein